MSSWFCDVQSLSTWTHAQLSAFGTRLWTGKEKSPDTVLKNETITKKIATQVEMSNLLKFDDSFSSKFEKLEAIQKQISDTDTVSEVSHTLTHDDMHNEKFDEGKNNEFHKSIMLDKVVEKDSVAVKAIVHAQDIISKTQKDHFENLLSCLEKSDVPL